MKWWQYILWPFGMLYGSILWFRRAFYLTGIFPRKKATIKSIVVGNLQVGGAGKTPMTIWLADRLEKYYTTAILSRGYGRKTRGFYPVKISNKAAECGDEPLEMRHILPEKIHNFVCEDRVAGINEIAKLEPKTNLCILDDAYQHLQLQGNVYVLLTEYKRLFCEDIPLPAGRLREFPSAAKDAHAIVVTKCPEDLDSAKALEIYRKLLPFNKPVFYCSYQNAEALDQHGKSLSSDVPVLLVSGLADNTAFRNWAENNYAVKGVLNYPDHSEFQEKDLSQWKQKLQDSGAAAILTTRKDWMRMKDLPGLDIPVYFTFTTPVFLFDGEEEFIALLKKELEK